MLDLHEGILSEFSERQASTADHELDWDESCFLTIKMKRRHTQAAVLRMRRAAHAWKLRNPERNRAIAKAYYQVNRERILASKKLRDAGVVTK